MATRTLNASCTVLTTNTNDIAARVNEETDNRNYFQIYLREEGKNYDFYDLIVCQVLNNGLVNKKFALPLSDSIDNKITDNDAVICTDTCMLYDCIIINYYQVDECICISCSLFKYRTVICAATNPNVNVYQFIQKELRATTDICDGGADICAAAITGGVTFDVLDACQCCDFTITRTCGSWISDGFVERRNITVAASEDAVNNNVYRATGVTALVLTIDKCFEDACMAIDSATAPDTTATFAQIGTDNDAEVAAVTLPAKACIGESDYWILNSANDERKYHVWYTLTATCACQVEPVVDLSTGIRVVVACDTTACQVATRTHTSLTSLVSGLTKNTHLFDFTAAVCAAVVTVTNRAVGRTTDAANASGTSGLTGLSVCVTTQGDLATTVGETADELLSFVGCCLVTSTGVFVERVIAACTNCTTHTDVCGVGRQFAFVSTGVLAFNSNLVCDGAAKYFMYYTCTPGQAATALCVTFSACPDTLVRTAGTWDGTCCIVVDDVVTVTNSSCNNANFRVVAICGATLTVCNSVVAEACNAVCVAVANLAFGSCRATLVDDNLAANITGTITGCCAPCACFTFDYDNNTQGGRTAAPCNNPNVTVVAIGLCSAQYVVVTSSIARTKTNTISVVAALERNFNNP